MYILGGHRLHIPDQPPESLWTTLPIALLDRRPTPLGKLASGVWPGESCQCRLRFSSSLMAIKHSAENRSDSLSLWELLFDCRDSRHQRNARIRLPLRCGPANSSTPLLAPLECSFALLQCHLFRRGTPTQAPRETTRLTLTSIAAMTALGDTLYINHGLCRPPQRDTSQAPSLSTATKPPRWASTNPTIARLWLTIFLLEQRDEVVPGSHSRQSISSTPPCPRASYCSPVASPRQRARTRHWQCLSRKAPDNPPILFTEAENSLGPFKGAPLRSPPKQLTKITSMVQHRDSSRSAFPNSPPRTCPEQLQYALFLLLLLLVSETLEPFKFSNPTNACNEDVLGEHRSMGTFGRRGAVREH